MRAILRTLCGCTKQMMVEERRPGMPVSEVKIPIAQPAHLDSQSCGMLGQIQYRIRRFELHEVRRVSPVDAEAVYWEVWQ